MALGFADNLTVGYVSSWINDVVSVLKIVLFSVVSGFLETHRQVIGVFFSPVSLYLNMTKFCSCYASMRSTV